GARGRAVRADGEPQRPVHRAHRRADDLRRHGQARAPGRHGPRRGLSLDGGRRQADARGRPRAGVGERHLRRGQAARGGRGEVTRALAIAGAIAASVALGCGVAPSAGVAPAVAREEAPAWRVRPPGGTQPIDPGLPASPGLPAHSGPPASADALLDARGCASCHAAITDEWSRSRHALAWTSSIFQTEYTLQPQAWCVNCHAPLTTQQADLSGPRAAQGVDCATCHVRAGKLVARARRDGSPHETIGDPTFGSPAFCADCHEFTFPVLSPETGAALRMTAHPMQNTVASFRAGPYARERE